MNSLNGITNVAGMIVTVALITTIVTSENTAKIIRAFGSAFSTSLRAAMGRG